MNFSYFSYDLSVSFLVHPQADFTTKITNQYDKKIKLKKKVSGQINATGRTMSMNHN